MKLSYLQQGFGSALPLILLHPYPLNSRFWRNQLSGLSHQRHVIAPNFRGYGATRVDSHDEISIKRFAGDIQKTLKNLEIDKAIFAGCSMGGYVLFELWRQAPELVAGMALINTRAEPDTEVVRAKRREQIMKIQEAGTVDLPDIAAGLLSQYTREIRQGIETDVRKWAAAPSGHVIIKTLEMLANRPDSVPTLATINVPTLILVGENDQITPPDSATLMHEKIKESCLIVVPDAGHLAPLENPSVVNGAMSEFLHEVSVE